MGPYRLLSQLGRGAYGEVWLAERDDWPDPVALKLPRARGGEHMARFAAEVEIARALDHPGIVRALDAGQDGQQLYCALVYHPGLTLAERLRTGPLSPNEACAVVHRMTLAMDHAHGHGVVHRDLKPANVILDARTGAPWITDFGLARGDDTLRLTQTQQSIGTPHYMAPEQIRDARHADARADVYALGAILFHLVSGRTPYVDGRAADVLACKLAQDPPRLDTLGLGISRELADVVARALARDPGDRFPTAAALAEAIYGAAPDTTILQLGEGDAAALRAALEDAGAGAPPPEGAVPRRLLLGLSAVALALAAAVVGLLVARRGASETAAPPEVAARPAPRSTASAGDLLRERLPAGVTPRATPEPTTPAPSPAEDPPADPADEPTPTWLEEGIALYEAGQLAEAEAALTAGIERGRGAKVLLEQNPDAVDVHLLNGLRFRAEARTGMGDMDGALEDQTRALELCPQLGMLWEERGATLWSLERIDEALADFDQALVCDPESLAARLSRVYVRQEAGDAEGAEADLTRLVELEPGLTTAWFERARARHTRGALAEAEADYDRHLELSPDSAEGLAWRGQLYIDTDRHRLAVDDLARALEVWPGGVAGRDGVAESLRNLRAFLGEE